MPMYVTLIRYTEQGIKTFKDLPKRLEETGTGTAGEAAEQANWSRSISRWVNTTPWSSAKRRTTRRSRRRACCRRDRGNVRTETLRAFTEDEAKKLAATVP